MVKRNTLWCWHQRVRLRVQKKVQLELSQRAEVEFEQLPQQLVKEVVVYLR